MTYPRMGRHGGTRDSACRKVLWPFHQANVPSSPTRTVPLLAGERPANASRFSLGPSGEKWAKSIALGTVKILCPWPQTDSTSAATLLELATAAAQRPAYHRSR